MRGEESKEGCASVCICVWICVCVCICICVCICVFDGGGLLNEGRRKQRGVCISVYLCLCSYLHLYMCLYLCFWQTGPIKWGEKKAKRGVPQSVCPVTPVSAAVLHCCSSATKVHKNAAKVHYSAEYWLGIRPQIKNPECTVFRAKTLQFAEGWDQCTASKSGLHSTVSSSGLQCTVHWGVSTTKRPPPADVSPITSQQTSTQNLLKVFVRKWS